MRIREADNTPHDERDAQQDDADDETPYGKTRRGDERDALRDASRDDRRDARNPKRHDEPTSGTTGANGLARPQRPDETTRENELTKTAHRPTTRPTRRGTERNGTIWSDTNDGTPDETTRRQAGKSETQSTATGTTTENGTAGAKTETRTKGGTPAKKNRQEIYRLTRNIGKGREQGSRRVLFVCVDCVERI